MDIHDKQDCQQDIQRIEELLSSGIFEATHADNVLQQSAFIEMMICLRDLMCKAEKYASRIDFTCDIVTNHYVTDVSDAITAIRDSCCHINSFKRLFDTTGTNRGSFNVVYGKGTVVTIDDLELKSEYDDDTAFFYGANRLYLKRHIVRAFEEAKALLEPLMSIANADYSSDHRPCPVCAKPMNPCRDPGLYNCAWCAKVHNLERA